MFALNGILSCNYAVGEEPAVLAYKYADEMLEARSAKNNAGLPSIRSRKPKK